MLKDKPRITCPFDGGKSVFGPLLDLETQIEEVLRSTRGKSQLPDFWRDCGIAPEVRRARPYRHW